MSTSPASSKLPLLLGGGLVVVAIALGAYKIATAPPASNDETNEAGEEAAGPKRHSKWFWEGDDEPQPRDDGPAKVASPRSLKLVDDKDEPIVGASVKIVSSPMTVERRTPDDHELVECDDFEHITRGAAELRKGKHTPETLGEGVSNEEGMVTFPARTWPRSVLIVVDRPGKPQFVQLDLYETVVVQVIDGQHPADVTVTAIEVGGEPINGARATVLDLATGAVSELRSDSSGQVRLPGGRAQWLILEADDRFPVALSIDGTSSEIPVALSRPGSIEVTAAASLGSFGVEVMKRHRRTVKVRDGRGLLELQHPGFVSVQVVEPGFLGSGEGLLDEGARLTLSLQVRRSGRLLLTVIDSMGNPVPNVSATLTSPSTTVSAEAYEEGQRLELGPMAEGPAVVRVTAAGFKSRAQSIELKPGDTDLEVVLAEAPFVTGRVVDSKGQPVPEVTVQVRADLPNEPSGAITDERGVFKLHVDEEGPWQLEAVGPEGEVARATAQVPGPDVVLTLQPLGKLVVTVLGVDGNPAAAVRVMIASAESPEPDFGETTETGQLTFEQLLPGEFRVEVDGQGSEEDFLPAHAEQVIRSGETAQLTVRLQPSAKIVGKLIDEEGAPVSYSLIVASGPRQRMAETDEQGAFTLTGLEPGETVELTLEGQPTAKLVPSSLKSGTTNQTVKLLYAPMVTGRVVDDAGKIVTAFTANGSLFETEDGHFEIEPDVDGVIVIEEATSRLWGRVEVKGRKDVGDVVLKRYEPFTGVVVDENRQPVASVRVISPAFSLTEVLTDARGHFEAELMDREKGFSIEARAGDLGTIVEVPAGKTNVELVLLPATRVEGTVRGPGGRPMVTSVTARGPGGEEVQVDTDDRGQFSIALAPGNWFFGTRAARSSRSVLVTGRTQRVDLGVPDDACEITVRGVPIPSSVMLVPPGTRWEPGPDMLYELSQVPAGIVSLGLDGTTFVARGVACGPWAVHAVYGTEVVTSNVTLSRGSPANVTVSAPSLASIGDSMGMNHVSERAFTDSMENLDRGQKNLDELLQPSPQNAEQIIE
ncbi:MAG: carboxypeptidase regulatory-like domain-containing protein [Archangiaceae bacterium]|nr:carboxypeptidase regulatory-like domain-containing protein [Archangiaceae bacterium]